MCLVFNSSDNLGDFVHVVMFVNFKQDDCYILQAIDHGFFCTYDLEAFL